MRGCGKRYPEAREVQLAHRAVGRARKNGELEVREDCERCGRVGRRIEAHHYRGYAPEHRLEVWQVCRPCHKLIEVDLKRSAARGRLLAVCEKFL